MEGKTVFFKEGVEILTEVPAGTLAQLCMWQLVVGQKFWKSDIYGDLIP